MVSNVRMQHFLHYLAVLLGLAKVGWNKRITMQRYCKSKISATPVPPLPTPLQSHLWSASWSFYEGATVSETVHKHTQQSVFLTYPKKRSLRIWISSKAFPESKCMNKCVMPWDSWKYFAKRFLKCSHNLSLTSVSILALPNKYEGRQYFFPFLLKPETAELKCWFYLLFWERGEGGGVSYFAGGLFSDVILRWCTVKNIHDTCNCRLES